MSGYIVSTVRVYWRFWVREIKTRVKVTLLSLSILFWLISVASELQTTVHSSGLAVEILPPKTFDKGSG